MSASKTQIDRLGERLKTGTVTDEDLEILDEFRRSHAGAYAEIIRRVRDYLDVAPTGRPAKSTTSIIDKLQRERLRLTQMQDIAGCRLVVSDSYLQSAVAESLMNHLESDGIKRTMVDRRESPSHGYRAVHIVASWLDKHVEIQIRTELQHLWSELSEKLSDIFDHRIKYGGGAIEIQTILLQASRLVSAHETKENEFGSFLNSFSSDHEMATNMREIARRKVELENQRTALLDGFGKMVKAMIVEGESE